VSFATGARLPEPVIQAQRFHGLAPSLLPNLNSGQGRLEQPDSPWAPAFDRHICDGPGRACRPAL